MILSLLKLCDLKSILFNFENSSTTHCAKTLFLTTQLKWNMADKDNYKKKMQLKLSVVVKGQIASRGKELSNSFGTLSVCLFYFIVNSALELLVYCNTIELEQGI